MLAPKNIEIIIPKIPPRYKTISLTDKNITKLASKGNVSLTNSILQTSFNFIRQHIEIIPLSKTFEIGKAYIFIAGFCAKTTTKATLSKDGSIVEKCSCGDVKSSIVIPKINDVTLSKTLFTYNEKVQKPSVTIKDRTGKVLKDGTDYTISYSNKNSKKVGEYKVTVTFKGDYSGSKTLTYQITPKGTKLSKVTKGKKQFKATWKKQTTETTGYQVQYSTSKNFSSGNKTITIKKNKTTSSTAKKLKSKKKYYVRIRTYKTVNGKKIYSGWSASKSVKIK